MNIKWFADRVRRTFFVFCSMSLQTPVNHDCGITLWLTMIFDDDIFRIDSLTLQMWTIWAGWRVWENICVPSVVCHRINNTHIVGTNRTKRGMWRYIFKKKHLPFINKTYDFLQPLYIFFLQLYNMDLKDSYILLREIL